MIQKAVMVASTAAAVVHINPGPLFGLVEHTVWMDSGLMQARAEAMLRVAEVEEVRNQKHLEESHLTADEEHLAQ